MRLDRFTVRGDRLKQIDWIEVRLEEQEQDQKFRSALAEEYGSMVVPQIRNPQIREYVLLTNGKPAYAFFAVQRLGRRVFRESPESDLGLQHRK